MDAEGGVDGASGPVELPPDADNQEIQYDDDDDDDIQAVQSETDNYLIDQSEATCRQVDKQRITKSCYQGYHSGQI